MASRLGSALAITSAVCFGTLAIFAKLGYLAGLQLPQVLAWRFSLAAAGLWLLAIAFGQRLSSLSPRRALGLFLMGLAGYSGQAFSFFGALQTLPASLVELVLYVYPALVAVAAWRLYGRAVSRLHAAALVASFAGIALLLGGVRLAGGPGLALALAAPLIYTAYILVGERLMAGAPPLVAAALAMTGAAVTTVAVATFSHGLAAPRSGAGWLVVLALAVIPTMAAVTLLLASLPLIGAGRAALLSTLEPAVTVGLAAAFLGERLAPLQIAGAVLVLGAVVTLQLRR